MSEDKLSTALARAAQAKLLLDSPLLQEAFDRLDAEYVKAWRGTMATEDDARQRLWQAVQIVGKVRDHLRLIVENGKLAQSDIAYLSQRARG